MNHAPFTLEPSEPGDAVRGGLRLPTTTDPLLADAVIEAPEGGRYR